MHDLIGKPISQFMILNQLSVRGSLRRFRAFQPSADRFVTLVVWPAVKRKSDKVAARFRQNGTTLTQLEHRGILPICDFGHSDSLNFVAVDYIESESAEDLLRKEVKLEYTSWIIDRVAEALDHAHEHGVVHGRLGPSDVLIDRRHSVLLVDFGSSLSTDFLQGEAKDLVQPPEQDYASPEVREGKKKDRQSDVYSLGMILQAMLAAGYFPASGPTSTPLRTTAGVPVTSSMHAYTHTAFERLILKATAEKPEDRYATAGELASAFRDAVWALREDREKMNAPHDIPQHSIPRKSEKSAVLATTSKAIGGALAIAVFILATLALMNVLPYRIRLLGDRVEIYRATEIGANIPEFVPQREPFGVESAEVPQHVQESYGAAWTLVFEDSFDRSRHRWPTGKDANGEYYIEDGKYYVREGGWIGQFGDFADFYLELKAKLLDSDAFYDIYGVYFRRSRDINYVLALDTQQQTYTLHAVNLATDHYDTILPGLYSPRIVSGYGENVIGVLCLSDFISISINGSWVDSIEDDRSLMGDVGLLVERGVLVAFDYIRIWSPSEQ